MVQNALSLVAGLLVVIIIKIRYEKRIKRLQRELDEERKIREESVARLAWAETLERDFEKQLAQKVHDELRAQPQVDGETWQFQGDSGEWVSFPVGANKEVMVKFGEGHETCEVVIDRKTYEIDFTKSSQMNQRTKKERKIRCFFDLPIHWQMTNEDALKLLKESLQAPPLHGVKRSLWQWRAPISQPHALANFVQLHVVTDQDVKLKLEEVLNQSLLRHDGSRCTCRHGSSKFSVAEAYQVGNLPLWRRYQRFVRSMRDKHKQHGISLEEINPSVSEALTEFARELNADLAGNERLLLHGTRDFEVAKVIAKEGFDNRICRLGLYGNGTYFAAQTCKSAQYARKEILQRVGTMLIARVAIGNPSYAEGPCSGSRPEIKNGVVPDSIIAKPGIPNDSNGGVQSHMEVVTFDPGQAYPEFIVRFTEE